LYGEWVEDSLQYWAAKEAKKSDEDYHGNFDAAQFERWFDHLCAMLAFNHGKCVVHLDGAKYHKRVLNPQPVARWRKAAIQEWLR
jgi:hypothetical protein